MKALMVTPWYYPTIGGTEAMVENISVKLNEMGISTDIMTFNIDRMGKPIRQRKIEKINGINVIKIPSSDLSLTRMFRVRFIPGRFVNILKNYDIIHFHNDVDLSFPAFSYFVAKPKIFHCHCLDITYYIYKQNFLSKYIFKNVADIYIAVSKCLVKLLVNLGIPRTKIRVVPNGIDVKRFQPRRETKIENLLLFVGRLDPKKGLPTLFESLNYLEAPVQLVIIGPPSYDAKYSKKILTLAKKVNAKTIHEVRYIGVQEPEEIVTWYQKASVFVCPSFSEPFGIVNLEALSCETPVVASNVGGIPEVVRNHENGILVPPNDAVKLAEGIQYLLDNAEIRKKFGEKGRRWVVKNFSSEIVIKKLLQIYKNMID